jgi:hypothetical protein
MKQALILLILGIVLIANYAKAADPDEHLSSTTYSTGDTFNKLPSFAAGLMEFDVKPKPGNIVWTSIRSCLGSLPGGTRMQLKTRLINMDTGEEYFWAMNVESNACTKETFDIPVHTMHNLKLIVQCYAPYALPGKTNYCRGFVTLFSSTHGHIS